MFVFSQKNAVDASLNQDLNKMVKAIISAVIAGTVTVSRPLLVNSSVKAETTPTISARSTEKYQVIPDISRNTISVQTKEHTPIATVPSTDFVPSINLPVSLCLPKR